MSSKRKPSRKLSRKQKGGMLGSNKQSNQPSRKKKLEKLIQQGKKVTFAAKLAAVLGASVNLGALGATLLSTSSPRK